MPFGQSDCAMNRICKYVEDQFQGYKSQLKKDSNFDYNVLKVKRRCTEQHRQKLLELAEDYKKAIDAHKKRKKNDNDKFADSMQSHTDDKNEKIDGRAYLQQYYCEAAKEICPNDDERLNIILDMCYLYNNNKQFCWDCIGDLICKRLEELNNDTNIE